MAEDDVVKKANASRSANFKSSKARTPTSKTNTRGTPAAPGIKNLLVGAPKVSKVVKEEKPKDFWEGLGETLDKPVIKQIIDGLSLPLYAVDNSLKNVQTRMQDASTKGQARGEVGIGNLGNTAQTAWEGLNPGSAVEDIVKGLGQGISGGFGNKNDATTASDLIRSGQKFNNIDTESGESRAVQMGLGLGLDIAMDPLMFVGGGKQVAAIKGAKIGAKKFKEEAALAKVEGRPISDTVEPTKWDNAKKQANVEITKYKDAKLDVAQAKQTKKAIKKSDLSKLDFVIENISTLRPGVLRALVKTEDDITEVMNKIDSGDIPTAKLDELVKKLDPDVPDNPKAATEAIKEADTGTPSVGLAQAKPPTIDEKLFDVLGKLRTTNVTPRYGADVVKNIREAMTVKETATKAGKVPDVKGTIKAIKDFDKEMRAIDPKTGKAGPGLSFPYKTPDGKRYSLTADEIIDTLDPTDAKFLENFEALDDFKVYKAAGSTKQTTVSDEVLRTLGLRSEDIELVHQGVKIEDITDEIEVGDIMAIARDIKNGQISEDALKPFYEMVGSTDRAAIAKFIETNSKTDEFKKVATQLSRYGSHRTGATPLPHLGVSGHGLNALPGKGFTADDILSAKTPANPEQSIKFLEAKYEESALALAAMPDGAELRVLADEIFKSTIDTQRIPKGPLRTKRGASRDVANTGAKFETKYNTHSAMHRITLITNNLRAMPDLAKNKSKYDDAFMAVLKDVDDRLRLSGFDPHLSNMRMMGDKLVVRLAPSDVFGALTKTQRTNWIHGNAMGPTHKTKPVSSKEYLPSTVLDVAEVLVRSTTRLLPDGSVDLKSMVTQAVATLQGKHAQLGLGKREIQSNLDVNAAIKNDQEILRNLDGNKDLGFAKLHREAKTKVDKDAVVSLAIAKHPEEFMEIAKARMNGLPFDVLTAFTKGFGEKPTILSDLINTNMRNASVFGGSVAKQIGEASAEYTAKVLDALDNGTAGDFLSALALKPPFKVTDSTANVLLQANLKAVKLSVADADELAHAAAIGSGGGGTKANVKAYQADTDLMEQVAKPPKEMDTDIIMDLSVRERNKDLLWRMYGTSRYFDKRAGMPLTFDVVTQSSHAASLLSVGYHGILRGWRARGIQPEQLRVAMSALKNDLPGSPLSDELGDIMRNLFDPGKMNFLNRNSIGPKHFNDILESVGFDKNKFQVPTAATPEEMINAWKTWDIVHVEDFLSKMMRAMTKTAEDVSMGASFSTHFGSVAPGPGLVKMVDRTAKGEKGNPFFPLIDHDLYYPKEIAEEVVHIGRLMTESRSFKPGTKTHTFVTKLMDPVISTLKLTQTTMKPGHHVMSVIGDGWRNNLALTTIGVGSPARQLKLYAESYRILRSAVGDIEELSDFAKLDRTQSLTSQLKIGSTQAGGFEMFANIGKGGKVTHADLYALMQAKGVALPQHLGGTAEDVLTDYSGIAGGTGSKIINAVDKASAGIDRLVNPLKPKLGMKHPYSLNKFSANRDTWGRGVMFLGAMRSRNFKSLDEASEFAANFVKKWAPTAIDLGGWETKIARRVIFYYTWLRGMVPRIIEGTLTKPGVAMIPNKAMYNLAQANGLDLNSIGDPFPEDTLFPSWYSQKVLGPQWEAGGDLWGFNPTGPLSDVMNSLGSNISPKEFLSPDAYTKTAGTFLNMSTPWFKAPMELVQGKSLVGGAPIEDPVQYVQDMFGPVRTASKVSGKDFYLAPGPDGLAMPNRTEKKFRNGMTEEQTVENALPELLNWASGMQFTNYTSDSAQNSAYYQDKEKAQEQYKGQERFR